MNVYVYVNGNVVNLVDPMGLCDGSIPGCPDCMAQVDPVGTSARRLEKRTDSQRIAHQHSITGQTSSGRKVPQEYVTVTPLFPPQPMDVGTPPVPEHIQKLSNRLIGVGRISGSIAMALGSCGGTVLVQVFFTAYAVDETYHGALQVETGEDCEGFVEANILQGSESAFGNKTAGLLLIIVLDPDSGTKQVRIAEKLDDVQEAGRLLKKIDVDVGDDLVEIIRRHGLNPDEDLLEQLRRVDAPGSGYRLGKHGDFPSPRPSGTQSHHGAMSAWLKRHYPGYNPSKAPAILMPTPAHEKTFGVYNKWRAAAKKGMGGTFDWGKVSELEMRKLSEAMFDAAEVPAGIRSEYWEWFGRMKKALE